MTRSSKKNRIIKWIAFSVLTTAALICFALAAFITKDLVSQQQALRWQGESETDFAQISCYIPERETVQLDSLWNYRTAIIARLKEASLEAEGENKLYLDAWSATGKVSVNSTLGNGKADVIAVGGNFFDFHPVRLISGNYIRQSDLMKDRVLIDEELAWLLFGGTDLQGLSFKINGKNFVVAGVVDREGDIENRIAYGGEMGLFMSWEAYKELDEKAGINCYEFVMAQPVENFALNFAKEKIAKDTWHVVENSHRFSFENIYDLIGQFGKRSMQTNGIIYPYWENAARYTEDWCALLLFLTIVFAAWPVVYGLYSVLRLLIRGKNKLEYELIPKAKENTQEAIRVRQRRRWERKRGLHEKR